MIEKPSEFNALLQQTLDDIAKENNFFARSKQQTL
jgi:hypothetical protein